MKTHAHRIQYYTRKVRQYAEGIRNTYRFSRLLAYKTEMQRRMYRAGV